MKKSILFFALFIFIANAKAQWIKMPITGASVDQYIDPSRIDKKRNPYPALWLLTDYKNQDQKSAFDNKYYKSVVALFEVDCNSKKYRLANAYYYQNSMGEGKIVDSINNDTGRFSTPPPNSPPEGYIKIICSN